MFEQNTLVAWSTSNDPNKWVMAFACYCILAKLRKMRYTALLEHLVMLGPGPELEPDLSTPKPENFDFLAYQAIKHNKLIKPLRKALIRDFYEDEDTCICEKSYALWLLTNFLKK